MRLPMDNPIFTKLQDIVEFSPKSPQWFSMAEQAVNTIYLLGEQPDKLCTKIIKDLTTKVFEAPEKETEIEREKEEGEKEKMGNWRMETKRPLKMVIPPRQQITSRKLWTMMKPLKPSPNSPLPMKR